LRTIIAFREKFINSFSSASGAVFAALAFLITFLVQMDLPLSNPQAKAKSCWRNAKFDWGRSTGCRASGACPDGKFARVPQENER